MADTLARGLGWASLGLAAPQIAAPERFARAIGVRPDARTRRLIRVVGARELGAATAIAVQLPRPVASLWARVTGDAMDLVLLAAALRSRHDDRRRLGAAVGMVAGIAALDAYAAVRSARGPGGRDENAARVARQASVTIGAPREEVHRRWRELVTQRDGPLRLAPLEVTDEEPGRRARWRATPEAGARASGVLTLAEAPGERGTELHLELDRPGTRARLRAAVRKLAGAEPLQQARDDLRRLKQLIEAGEAARSDGTPEGHRAARHLRQRPAQPVESAPT